MVQTCLKFNQISEPHSAKRFLNVVRDDYFGLQLYCITKFWKFGSCLVFPTHICIEKASKFLCFDEP